MGSVGRASIDALGKSSQPGVAQEGWVVLAGADRLSSVRVCHDGPTILTAAPGGSWTRGLGHLRKKYSQNISKIQIFIQFHILGESISLN